MIKQKEVIMDDESKGLIFFFKKLNIVLLIISLIGSCVISFGISKNIKQQQQIGEIREGIVYDDLHKEYNFEEDEPKNNDSNTSYDGMSLFLTLIFSLFISIFNYNLVLILLKHFSNLAELKEIKKIEYLNK
ncbi:hypothetical protein [Vagococcus hydrophili]|uniref:Uncharacterized protein n=1 Tax=Vagococcus hydrophili TaxID=2714947 RepID=A0A6G8AWG0_9ENTE|nr:hypothetical protein [Vagococcus hydrophili]QIL49394.1 hypothetical protein G7082_13240 [Vagococcus hydrophili]